MHDFMDEMLFVDLPAGYVDVANVVHAWLARVRDLEEFRLIKLQQVPEDCLVTLLFREYVRNVVTEVGDYSLTPVGLVRPP